MRAWLIALAITSVTFAATTVYLARELSRERERMGDRSQAPVVASESSRANDTGAAANARAQAQPPASGGAQTQVGAAIAAPAPRMTQADIRKAQAEYSRRFLARIADPQQRDELLAERKVQVRSSYPRLEQVLGLTPEQHARLVELQARQQIDMEEASARCMADPACDFLQQRSSPRDFHGEEIASLLGPDGLQKFATYKNTLGEREAVTQLKGRLPDSQRLGDERAEQLITALAQERDTLNQEAFQRGEGMSGFGIGAGMVFAPADDRPFEERYEAARRYSQRLRDRAAQYLNPEQQRVFDEMQEDTLLSLRSALRNKDHGGYTAVTVNAGS